MLPFARASGSNAICQELYGTDLWTLLGLMERGEPKVKDDSKAKLEKLQALYGDKAEVLEENFSRLKDAINNEPEITKT